MDPMGKVTQKPWIMSIKKGNFEGIDPLRLPETNSSHLPGIAIPKGNEYTLPSIQLSGTTVDGSEIPRPTTVWMVHPNPVNDGR